MTLFTWEEQNVCQSVGADVRAALIAYINELTFSLSVRIQVEYRIH